MNELDLLARLRPDVPEPDPALLQRHRTALLRHTKPARNHRPWVAIGTGLTTAAAAIAIAIAVPGSEPAPGPHLVPVVSTATLLDNAAAVAATTPSGDGPWVYTNRIITKPGSPAVRYESWTKRDGGGGFGREHRDGQTTDFPAARPFTGGPGHPKPMREGPPPPSLFYRTYDYLAGLPTDPVALRNEIYAQARTGIDRLGSAAPPDTLDSIAFRLLAGAIGDVAPPEMKRALYQVAGTLPGARLVDSATDAAGRHGIGITFTTPHLGHEVTLIFDRAGYQLLGTESRSPETPVMSSAILDGRLVSEAGQTR